MLKKKNRNRNRCTDVENKLVVTKGESEGEEKIRGMGLRDTNTLNFIHRYITMYKIDKQQGYIVQHRDYSHHLVITFNRA